MISKKHTLASGRVVTLAMPDLYKLVATDAEIPSNCLTDILDLVTYGAMISGTGNDKKRLEENRRFIMSLFQVAALCIQEPKLVLMGAASEGDLTPSDLVPRDLRDIADFFQTGGSSSVSTTADQESSKDTQTDLPSATVEKTAE